MKKILIISILLSSVCIIKAETVSGTCGDDGSVLNWSFDTSTGIFTIRGTGAMRHYTYSSDAPWHQYRSQIEILNLTPGLTIIGRNAFSYCSNLELVIIPSGVTLIGGEAFSACSSLRSISIPNTVNRIAPSAFSSCTALEQLFIPESVTDITSNAFAYCTALSSITCEASNPPTLSSGVFYEVDKSIPLYVPTESVTLYQTANGWKEFYNILPIQGTQTTILDIPAEIPQNKIMYNGKLLIRHNDKLYSITGAEVNIP